MLNTEKEKERESECECVRDERKMVNFQCQQFCGNKNMKKGSNKRVRKRKKQERRKNNSPLRSRTSMGEVHSDNVFANAIAPSAPMSLFHDKSSVCTDVTVFNNSPIKAASATPKPLLPKLSFFNSFRRSDSVGIPFSSSNLETLESKKELVFKLLLITLGVVAEDPVELVDSAGDGGSDDDD
jgi:hypothetical protein